MKQITLRDFEELCELDLKASESLVVVGEDGDYLATIIVPQTDFLKLVAEHLGELSNSVRPAAAVKDDNHNGLSK
jgi:hypothetical protein